MLSKLSHMQTRNDVQSYIAASCCWSQFRPGYIRLLLLFIVVVVVVIFVHFTNFLQSCCSLLLLQRVHASGFLISFPVHVCVLFILSSNNNYVCFARLMYILICDNSAHIQRIHGALLVKKNTIYHIYSMVVLSIGAAFQCGQTNWKLLSSYLYLQQWRWFCVSYRPNLMILQAEKKTLSRKTVGTLTSDKYRTK